MNWNDIKAFYLRGTSLMRLIYINVGAFVLVKLVSLCLILFNINTASVTSYLELPSNLMMLIRQPWSIITYMFMHADVMHIFFNMISLYWFGRIALERISQKQLVALYVLGGLAGGALVSASRPRPVFVNPPLYAPYPPRPYPPYPPYRPYGNPGGYYNYSSGGYY